MNKKAKGFLVYSGIAFVSLYFVSGIVFPLVVNHRIFDVRLSSPETLSENQYLVQNGRADYPILSNREEIVFSSSGQNLVGYLYKASGSKGVALCAHGMTAQADGPDAQYQHWFLAEGYDVFALDLTASGRSQGDSMKGLHQSAYDVSSAYQALGQRGLLHGQTVLVGHSWGAFGVAASLSLGVYADRVVCFAAYDNPLSMMFETARIRLGDWSYLTYPMFSFTNQLRYGGDATLSASKAIEKTKAFLVQGELDVTVPYPASLYGKTLGQGNVVSYLRPSVAHITPWKSLDALWSTEIDKQMLANLEGTPEKEAYIQNVDKNRNSALDEDLFAAISAFLH